MFRWSIDDEQKQEKQESLMDFLLKNREIEVAWSQKEDRVLSMTSEFD